MSPAVRRRRAPSVRPLPGLGLAAMLLATYAYFYQSGQHNAAARLDMTRALAMDGTLAVDAYGYNSADLVAVERDGQRALYSGKAPGLSLLAVPPFRLAAVLLSPLRAGEERWYWHLVVHITIIFTVGLPAAAAAWAVWWVVRRATGDDQASLAAVLAVWLGTIVFPFATHFYGHVTAAALLALGFAALFRERHQPTSSPRLYALAGLALGWAVITEFPTVLLAALVSVYAVITAWSRSRPPSAALRRLAAFGAGALPAVAALMIHNHYAFGSALKISYDVYAASGEASGFPAHARGLLGVYWRGLAEYLDVLAEITVRPRRGMLYAGVEDGWLYACSPVLWLVLPGLVLMARRRELRLEAVLVAIATAVYLSFNACYGDSIVYWGGGTTIGARHLLPLLPFLALPLAFAARTLWPVFVPLALLSIAWMWIATAVDAQVSYHYGHPWREFLQPKYLDGRFAVAHDGLFDPEARPLVGDSVAFNLAKVAGIPGPWQLLPLAALWVGGVFLLLRRLPASRARPLWIAAATVVVLIALGPVVHYAVAGSRYAGSGLTALYYANPQWTGEPWLIRVDRDVDYIVVPPGGLGIVWEGELVVEREGEYGFRLHSDDGSFLEVDGRLVVDNGGDHGAESRSGSVHLSPGRHPLRLRYFNSGQTAEMRLYWTPPGEPEVILHTRFLRPLSVPRNPS